MVIDNTLYHGRPDKAREAREDSCYDLLDALGIDYYRVDHEHADTIEACREVEMLLGCTICKNLFLCNRQKTDFYLYLSLPDRAFRTADISKKLQVSRLSFAPDTALPELLNMESGSLSPLGLWWDTEHRVTLVMDHDLRQAPRLAFHPCDHTGTVLFTREVFYEKVLPSLHCVVIELHVGS